VLLVTILKNKLHLRGSLRQHHKQRQSGVGRQSIALVGPSLGFAVQYPLAPDYAAQPFSDFRTTPNRGLINFGHPHDRLAPFIDRSLCEGELAVHFQTSKSSVLGSRDNYAK
jgi:hypothetical protein